MNKRKIFLRTEQNRGSGLNHFKTDKVNSLLYCRLLSFQSSSGNRVLRNRNLSTHLIWKQEPGNWLDKIKLTDS